jgi:hypothetical protein
MNNMPYTTLVIFAAFDPLPAADLNANFANLDYLNNKINAQFVIPASAMYPATTQGAAAGTLETTTNKNDYNFVDFADTAGALYAEFLFPLPSDYGGGTITAKFYWTANSVSGNSVVWGIQAIAIADDEPLDVAFGTLQSVTDANHTTAYDLNISGATGAMTIGGTPAAGELVIWRVFRSSGNASDTLAATARLLAVVIEYTRS